AGRELDHGHGVVAEAVGLGAQPAPAGRLLREHEGPVGTARHGEAAWLTAGRLAWREAGSGDDVVVSKHPRTRDRRTARGVDNLASNTACRLELHAHLGRVFRTFGALQGMARGE